MQDHTPHVSAPHDVTTVAAALRDELPERGHHLSGDTTGMHTALYIMGDNDVASALFEFRSSASDAIYELMYQGAWVAGMPPRFVVLPNEGSDDESLETLEQIKAMPLLFDIHDGQITFRDLDERLRVLDAR
jgi:hypothetical protein